LIATKEPIGEVNSQRLKELMLMRLPRSMTDALDPAVSYFQDPTLSAWFAAHDYVFPTPQLKRRQSEYEQFEIFIHDRQSLRKYRFTEEQIRLFISFLGGQETPKKIRPDEAAVAIPDLMDQPKFSNAMTLVNDLEEYDLYLRTRFLLANYPKELAYKIILLGSLPIDQSHIQAAVTSNRPEVLRGLCPLPEAKPEQWAVNWDGFDEWLASYYQSSGLDGGIQKGFHDALDACREIKPSSSPIGLMHPDWL